MEDPTARQDYLDRLRDWRRPRETVGGAAFIADYFTRHVQRPHREVAAIVQSWQEHVPADLVARTALAGLRRGVLEVHVTDSAALFQVDRLLRGGLQQRLAESCRSPLRKVRLRVAAASILGASTSRR